MLKPSMENYNEHLAREKKRSDMEKLLHDKAVEAARALISNNYPENKISEITGLSPEEIKNLKAQP